MWICYKRYRLYNPTRGYEYLDTGHLVELKPSPRCHNIILDGVVVGDVRFESYDTRHFKDHFRLLSKSEIRELKIEKIIRYKI